MYIKYVLSLVLILVILFSLNSTNRETYINVGDARKMREQKELMERLLLKENPTVLEQIQIAAYNSNMLYGNKTIYSNQKDTIHQTSGDYALDDIVDDIMNGTTKIPIVWENVYVDQQNPGQKGQKGQMQGQVQATEGTVLTLMVKPNEPGESADVKSILHNTMKDEMCTKYLGNNEYINQQCKLLGNTNCKTTSCCVLVNGNQCVAGNARGPTYLTDAGAKIDQNYYYNKNRCYGNCLLAQSYQRACGGYGPNSTGISKNCMIQMFNNYGCPNKNPNDLINDDMVEAYRPTTKTYVESYIKTAVNTLKNTNEVTAINLCTGTS